MFATNNQVEQDREVVVQLGRLALQCILALLLSWTSFVCSALLKPTCPEWW